MNELKSESKSPIDDVNTLIRLVSDGVERRSYRKPALRRLGLLRAHTARRASPGVTVSHDSGTGADTFTF